MGRYRLFIKPSALKELKRLPGGGCARVVRGIQSLADDPRPPGTEKLTSQGRYRLRQGVFRIVYSVSDEGRTVVVVKLAHRRDVYGRGE